MAYSQVQVNNFYWNVIAPTKFPLCFDAVSLCSIVYFPIFHYLIKILNTDIVDQCGAGLNGVEQLQEEVQTDQLLQSWRHGGGGGGEPGGRSEGRQADPAHLPHPPHHPRHHRHRHPLRLLLSYQVRTVISSLSRFIIFFQGGEKFMKWPSKWKIAATIPIMMHYFFNPPL